MMLIPEGYYRHEFVRYELVKQLQHKYLNVRGLNKDGKYFTRRYYLGYCLKLLDEILFKKLKEPWNLKLYNDLSYFDPMPRFSYDHKKSKEQKVVFDREYFDYAYGFDMAFDFDHKNLDISHSECKVVVDLLDEKKVPYSVKYSGTKGFHVMIKDEWLPDIKFQDKVKMCHSFVKTIKDVFNLSTIDYAIMEKKRFLKLSYSLDRRDSEYMVVLPLTEEQFKKFDIDMVRLKTMTTKIFNRGMLERNHKMKDQELRQNTENLIKEYVEVTDNGKSRTN